MRRARPLFRAHGALGAVAFVGGFVALIGACGDDRGGFTQPAPGFDTKPEAGAPDAEACYLQCSLDGRTIIDSCTGAVVDTCADDLACGAAKCQEPCAAAEADRSSNGCDFYFQRPVTDPLAYPMSCFATFVVNASNQPATVSLELRGEALDVSRALFRALPNSTDLEPLEGPIAPGESAILFVADWESGKARTPGEMLYHSACPVGAKPAVESDSWARGSTIGDAFRLKSNVPVGVTWMYPYGGAGTHFPTATLVLPVSAWAKEHLVVDGWEANLGIPMTQIFAAEDDTEVTIVGSKDVANGAGFTGAAAGKPAKIKLAKGQFAQLVQTQELTGSLVYSDKPTVTVGGNGCAFLPSRSGPCDTLAQQIPPYEQWGSEYVGVGYRPRSANTEEIVWYRMVGARDGTELEYDPVKPAGAPLTISAGELVLFRARSNDAFVVRSRDAEHPFYLGMHMSSGDGETNVSPSYGGMGDPEFVNVVASGQYMSSYSFYADSSFSEHSLVIVRKKTHGDFKDVWLECAGNLPDWKPIDSAGQYEYRRVDLSRNFGPGDSFGDKRCRTGLQRMRSDGAFSATLWGWGSYSSYAYPGGMAIRKLVETALPPVN